METGEKVNKGLKALEEKVFNQGLCAACGACLSLCPYLRSWKGKVVKLDDCNLEEGRCFAYCPRTEVDLDKVYNKIFGKRYEEIEMGPFRKIMMARAKDSLWRKKAQTGGVVSALMDFALREKMIQAAILTPRDGDLLPEGKIIKGRKEILSCAGSSYVSGPTLEALNRGPWKGEERIGIVGLPCQVLSLARMKTSVLEKRTPIDQVNLVVGLFCTWAFDYKPFMAFLRERTGGVAIKKLDITPPPERILEVTGDGQLRHIPLDDVRPFIRPSCRVCLDMTAELSDISVGTVEGKKSWNTVIVRTEMGEKLLSEAKRAGVIETRALPEDNLNHLKEASLLKKRRALDALREKGGIEKGYFTLSANLIKRILSEPGEVKP
ncbi:MAG TPA: Coenzyme F420 hydrogenase/dehydrogenase, beta subunit C-terminal domain [Thermodesulfobacteriota bacterium]|nr:Coenzyme F420 hydrogenase/dehydrogenase, beta subunit C-terminal domain [Thermodesulfobacteriota bacterium]